MDAAPDPPAAPVDICDALRGLARTVSSKHDFYREMLRTLARHLESPYAVIQVESSAGVLDDHVRHGESVDDRWQSVCDGLLLDARYRNVPMARRAAAASGGEALTALAVPIAEAGKGTVGSLVIVVSCESKTLASAQLSELNALVAVAGTLVSSLEGTADKTRRASLQQDHAGIAKAGGHKTMHEFAFALANGLKSKLGCEQVILGLVRGRHVKVVCMSGFDDLYPRSPGARLIHDAMEECVDAGMIIGYQQDGEVADEGCCTGHLLHKHWHHRTGNASVASIPLRVDGEWAAVLSVRNGATRPLKKADLRKIQEMVEPLVPGLLLMELAHRNLWQHGTAMMRDAADRWLGRRGGWGRKVTLAAALLVAAWLGLGTAPFTVTVPCQVVPDRVRQLAAPFEGTIAAAHVKPGDTVAAGQVLVILDTRELVLERERLLAEVHIAQLDRSRALIARDHSAAARAESRMEMARSQLQVADYRIAKSKVRAPVAGVILSGDVRKRVGEVVPLGAPLLQLAPHGNWAIELRAPEFAALYLEAGQTGRFTTSARPDEVETCRLERVDVAAEVVNGKNVFVARAQVGSKPKWIRVGMTGVARVHIGRRPVWWVALHGTIDAIRLQLWKL